MSAHRIAERDGVLSVRMNADALTATRRRLALSGARPERIALTVMGTVTAALTGCRSILMRLVLFLVCAPFGFGRAAYAADLTFLDPHGAVAAAQRQHFVDILLIMLIVLVPVFVGVPLIVWRYRYGNPSAHYSPRWGWSTPLEPCHIL